MYNIFFILLSVTIRIFSHELKDTWTLRQDNVKITFIKKKLYHDKNSILRLNINTDYDLDSVGRKINE